MLIHEYLINTAKRLPDKVAVICGDKQYTYAEINQASDHLAMALIQSGCQKGDRVLVFTGNTIETVISVYGILKAGGIFVVINPSQKAPKLNYILKDTESEIIIIDRIRARVIESALDGGHIKNIIWCGCNEPSAIPAIKQHAQVQSTLWQDLIHARGDENRQAGPNIIDIDLAALFYTSGTTGVPKGIITAHYNAEAVMKSLTTIFTNCEDDIILNALPLSFDYGLYQFFMAFMYGATVVLEKSFLYPFKIAKTLEENRVTGFPFVPTMAALLFKLTDINHFDFSHVRYITSSTAALPPAYIPKLQKLFKNADLFSRYGLSESVTATYLPPSMLDSKINSVGIPIPNTDAYIVDSADRPLPPGETGELVIRGSIVMQGYWKAPDRTSKVFRKGAYRSDSLLYTGDLFRQDEDGYLYFVARKDDLIKTGGERVSPKEVENTLISCSGVLEAAVIGVPDNILGTVLKAYLAPENNQVITEKDVLNFCNRNLETFMIPKYIEISDSLPKTENGKIDKKLLLQQTIAELDNSIGTEE